MLTLLRIALVPVLVLFFYLPFDWSNFACTAVFVLAAVTDIADGYIARKTGQMSRFGEFLDPVADKIMVATALILLVQRQENYQVIFAISAAIIVGRELTISALREWMSEIGEQALLLYRENMGWIPIALIGELLLYAAAALTLWSMWVYLKSAWPVISDPKFHVHYHHAEQSEDDAA